MNTRKTAHRFSRTALLFLGAALVTLAGCARPTPPLASTSPPTVIFEVPVTQSVTEYEDFTGHTEAFEYVEIKANVPGYLTKIHVPEGTNVRQGETLFTIDPRMYQAQEASARATVEKARADLKLAEASFLRAKDARMKQVIGQEEYDRYEATRDAAVANLDAAVAAHDMARTNLGYTSIKANFTGRLGKKLVSEGSLVKEKETLLRIRRLIAEGRIPTTRERQLRVRIGLADEEGYSLEAPVTFSDNTLDPNTGTFRVRAELENPDLKIGSLPGLVGAAAAIEAEQRSLKLLSRGMFVRVRVPIGRPHPALMIPEEALGSDQGERFVYVINDKDEVVYRRIQPGIQEGRYRVIESGVKPGERVIVSGHQRVRPGVKVTPKKAEAYAPASPPARVDAAEPEGVAQRSETGR